MPRPKLAKHQVQAVRFAEATERGLLADEPGLGKTASAITSYDGGRNLVIAPAMVIDGGTWTDELHTWSDFHEGWTVVPFTSLSKRVSTGSGGTRPIAGAVNPAYAGPWDAIVIDEAHYIKNRNTNWTATIDKLAKNSGAVLAMTGTPISHWASDLFTTLRLLNPSEAKPGGRFGSYWRWVEEWFETEQSRFGGAHSKDIGGLLACKPKCKLRPAHKPCKHYRQFMAENMGDRFLRRLRDDVLGDLPPMTVQQVSSAMDRNQSKMYREMKEEYVADLSDGSTLEAWSDGARINFLTKLTTSSWLVDKKGPPKGGKFELLRYDLQQRSRPTLVFGHYRDTVEACAAVAESVGASARFIHGGTSRADRAAIVAQFKAGQLDVLVGSLEVLAEGLTLTAADMAIFVELSYKPSRNKQARQRVHRWGQTRPVTVREYITPKTVDSRRLQKLNTKNDHELRMMSAAEFAQML